MAKYTRTNNLGISTRYSIILMSLLTLIGILGGCGASTTVSPSQPTGSTRTSTPTHKLKGTIREIPLPANLIPGDITNGPDGNLWIAGNPIGRTSPTGVIHEFPLPAKSFAIRIINGPDGNLWCTEDTSNHSQEGKIGRITLTGSISEFPLPNPRGGPFAITGGPDGTIWFTKRNSNKIGHLV